MNDSHRRVTVHDGETNTKSRIRFQSQRKRAREATADVYRSYKRRTGSAAVREEQVHAHVPDKDTLNDESTTTTTFASELDIAMDRNASEIFAQFHREIWPLVRSLPEILHNAPKIVNLLLMHVLSPEDRPGEKTPMEDCKGTERRQRYVVNQATTDILHLLAVLARDLRQEIHPFLHAQVLPRIVYDLLSPTPLQQQQQQQQPLDVAFVEAAVRTMSYLFRYDAETLLAETTTDKDKPCLEPLRRYYGVTLAHRRPVVRRLMAEAVAPLIRQLTSESARQRHLRRVLRALQQQSSSSSSSATVVVVVERVQLDAIDGIAHLLMEVARGAPGCLHSRGQFVIQCVLDATLAMKKTQVQSNTNSSSSSSSSDNSGRDLVFSVATTFFDRLAQHLRGGPQVLSSIVSTLLQTAIQCVNGDKIESDAGSSNPQQQQSIQYALRLVEQLSSYRNGWLLKRNQGSDDETPNSAGIVDQIEVLLKLCLQQQRWRTMTGPTQRTVLDLFCSTWKLLPDNVGVAERFTEAVTAVLVEPIHESNNNNNNNNVIVATVLVRKLLPHLRASIAMSTIGKAVLSTAAQLAQSESHAMSVVALIHTIVTVQVTEDEAKNDSDHNEDHDNVFFLEHASACALRDEEVESLLNACLLRDIDRLLPSDEGRTQLMACGWVAAFVTVLGGDSRDNHRLAKNYKRVSKWFLALLTQLDKATGDLKEQNSKINISLVLSMIIDAFSQLSTVAAGFLKDQSAIKSALQKADGVVLRHLKANPERLWVLKSVSGFVATLMAVGLQWDKEWDAVFELLTPNLRDRYHFCRLHTLQILAAYPKRSFVVDHADLDLSGDLDEETSEFHVGGASSPPTSAAQMGLCNVIDMLLAVESTPPNLEKERYISSLILRVGVLGRSGKLPSLYAEAAASHMLGVFHIKFTPLWAAAVKAIVGLATGHEACVWPALHHQIEAQVQNPPYRQNEKEIAAENTVATAVHDPFWLYRLCANWESSRGDNAILFDAKLKIAEELGKISRHHVADTESVFQSLWSVVEGAPQLVAAHSRTVVPIFLDFLRLQYFIVRSNDPDARELSMVPDFGVEEGDRRYDPAKLDSRALQRRLNSMLKAFASVNGPQQLFKHKLLLSIFVSLLSHQDTACSQTAFSCVLKFKLPYLVHVSDILRTCFEKGKLREALMELKSIDESGVLIDDHRRNLLPILSRILFGRFASRASGKKSSKDSPTARRTAVLSFLSEFCRSDDDLYPFLYLMTRVYIPLRFETKAIENQNSLDRASSLSQIKAVTPADCSKIRAQIHQGFLNALDAVLSQFGHRVEKFVPIFMTILLSLCKAFEVNDPKLLVHDDVLSDVEHNEDEKDDHHGCEETRAELKGTIRSLCYRCLGDVFSMFSEKCDLAQYSGALWDSLRQSLVLLPVMVINADKSPSLLTLLRTISGEKSLVRMLKDDENVVPAALKCLSGESRPAVADTTLSFIDNLLSDDDSGPKEGRLLLKCHVELLLDRFRLRLAGKPSAGTFAEAKHTRRYESIRTLTWRRELTILCRVSELIDEFQIDVPETRGEVLDNLCSLLTPFLDGQTGVTESDKLHVLEILDRIISKIPVSSAVHHYDKLSALFGPCKAKAGNASREMNRALAGVLDKLAASSFTQARRATKILGNLCAISARRVDETDYDKVIPALGNLGDDSSDTSWLKLSTTKGGCEPSILSPLLYACFHFLYDEDGVVSRSAFKSLKSLIAVASDCGGIQEVPTSDELKWQKLLKSCVVPLTRDGLASRKETARRFFVLLMSEVAKCNKTSTSPNLYGDLCSLIREDEPDLDFFLNITHVQIHRRARALQRLRKHLNSMEQDSGDAPFSSQSLSNILLPLATHPIYESKMKIEEGFALEGIATVGAIARHLSWNKYNSILWTHLNQFERHPEQEKYLIGLICAVIDAFHFDVESANETFRCDGEKAGCTAVWRALENRIIPKIEGLLVKEKVEKNGKKLKILRSPVVLAQLKLFRKLPTKLFEAKLPRLLTVICDALRNRDSDAREVARTSLAKMVVEMDMVYLADVVRELATSLTEGYKLHVRTATLHTILLELSKVYKPPVLTDVGTCLPDFDQTVPALMDLIQQDLFGAAQEWKDAEGSNVRFVKEAGGSKSSNALELIASMILFQPSTPSSSIHAMVLPLLERLQNPFESPKVVRRLKESLSRTVNGLLKNPSLKTDELLLFVRATLQPFVSQHEIDTVMATMDDDSSSENEDNVKPIKVSGSTKSPSAEAPAKRGELMEWRPSMIHVAKSSKAALDAKKREEAEIARVRDGASAPRLTGSKRNSLSPHHHGQSPSVNDPAVISVVMFGLQLLNPTLKKASDDEVSAILVDPFVPLLTTCVCCCRDTDVVMLALRCLGWLLKLDRLPSLHRCAKSLATKTLELLTSAGTNQELLQSAFKMLTLLLQRDRRGRNPSATSKYGGRSSSLPLDDDQMQILISFLQESVLTSDQHGAAITLIKAVVSRLYLSPEIYDLMETLLKQSVRSSSNSLRNQSARVFLNFLLNYPLAEERIEQHLKQIVLNLNYEHTEGRLSGISLATSLLENLPTPLLEKHCQLFFFPLTLQLANDDSKECREACTQCVRVLLKRLPTEMLRSIYGYVERWSQGDVAVKRMSLQLFAITVETRADFVKRGATLDNLLATVQRLMEEHRSDWEIIYFALILLEKIGKSVQNMSLARADLWDEVVASMAHSHSWVKMASTRLLFDQLNAFDPKTFVIDAPTNFLVGRCGLLHIVARNLCFQIGADEDQQSDDLTSLVVRSLTWVIQAMKHHPQLCFDKEEKNEEVSSCDPVLWVITRLSNIARPKGTKRRQAVFKCFAAFATFCGDVVLDYLELMLEPLHRTEAEARNELELPSLYGKTRPANDPMSEEAQVAKDVLHLLEEKCGDERHEDFMKAYASVKSRALEKKEKRKLESKVEAVVDPQNAAKHRIQKQDREKHRRKRRVEERRMGRGVKSAKRRYL